MTIQAVLFDFDYTLADSSQAIIDCTNKALQSVGAFAVSDGWACQAIGLSLGETYRFLAEEAYQEEKVDAFIRAFVHRADQIMLEQTRIFDEVPGVLRELRENGFKTGIVSTKFRFRIEGILRRNAMESLFDLIIGGEDVSRHKPDPEGVLQALSQLSLHPSDCLYIGDSLVDAETAQRARTSFLPVLTGVTQAKAFTVYRPRRCLKSLAELPEILRDWAEPSASVG
ncbi:MAG TPA: HAD-IA family hydrolase [Bacillota bacterium]|nr:HAD-IA family hydrolase [Bacillota bacterium]